MMRRILPLSLLVLALTGGVALADPDRARGVRDHRFRDQAGPVYRGDRSQPRSYNRSFNRGTRYDRGYVRLSNRAPIRAYNPSYSRGYDRRGYRGVAVTRTRPVLRDNRFYFSGGFYQPYYRPVINVRYRDYYRRPALIVENYAPVAGYVWIQGRWSWNGYEWIWVPGYYDVDPAYQDPYYPGTYDDGYYPGAYDYRY